MNHRSPGPKIVLLALLTTFSFAVNAPTSGQEGEDPNAQLFELFSSIFVKTEDLQAVLDKGADPNATNDHGDTILAIAAFKDEPDAVKLLLEAGAKVDAPSGKYQVTPLMLAMQENNPRVVPILLEAGADIEAKDVDGWTPTIWAAHRDSLNAFRALTEEKSPKLDVLDKEGWSALTMAVRRASRNMIERLIEHGAKWSEPVGDVPFLLLAIQTGDFITVNEVLEHFPDLEVRGPEKETPLIAAAKRGHVELMVDLLRRGADRTAKDAEGKTALDHAKEQEHTTVAGLLGGEVPRKAPTESTVVEIACEPLGGKLRVGLEKGAEAIRLSVYYPRIIHSYLSELRDHPEGIEPELALHLDTDDDRSTGWAKGSATHEVGVGAEWTTTFTSVWDGTRINNQHTPATRSLQARMYKEGEEMNSWDMDDFRPETVMELDQATVSIPFSVIGASPDRPLRVGIEPAACPSSSKTVEIGT
jgi:ankyrin repeat protein